MQAGVGNYQTINANVVHAANNPTICENKGRYYFERNNKLALFSQMNKDK